MDAEGVGHLLGSGMAIAMTIALCLRAQEDQRAAAWGMVFVVVAVIQIGRTIQHLRKRKR